MRRTLSALAIALLVGTTCGAAGAPVARAAATQTKVVIVVGATQGVTSNYRAEADVVAAQFAKYTSNIIKVYSPNATWSAVATAAQGANVLVYMGHGSGFPNPYLSYEQPNGDNGMGLNASAAGTDNNTQYYGENYMALLNLAPNAVVMLNHLCYASGDNEWGAGLPSAAVAHQRVDGYASGFLRGGAKAVIAEGMSSLEDYITGLFTAHSTIDAVWKASRNFHNHVTSWASTRNAGYTSQIDPDLDHPASDGDVYYASMVSMPDLATDSVISGQVPPFVSQTGTYYPLAPTRVVDTRGNGIGPTGRIDTGGAYTYTIAGRGGVPADAIAVTANVTVTNQTSFGWVFVGPQILGLPASSTINFPVGDNRANGVTVPLSAKGTLDAWFKGSDVGSSTDLIIDVTGFFMANGDGDGYVAFGPQRILDTRTGTGLTGKFYFAQPRKVQVLGVAGLPGSGVVAVSGNVTVVNGTDKGFVFVGPTAAADPPSSTLNFPAGDIRANNFIVPIADDGTIAAVLRTGVGSGSTDLVIDITGYFIAGGGAPYHTLNPTRILDSRTGTGLQGPIPAVTAEKMQVTGAGGVPAGALAITANLTVTQQTYANWAAIGPSSDPAPTFSNLNFGLNDNRANGVIAPLTSDGLVYLVYGAPAGQTTHLVLDVCGYFQ
jgi:hypothetical protein